MENSLKNTQNFEDVQKAHTIFITNVMSRTFLTVGERHDRRSPVCYNQSIYFILHHSLSCLNFMIFYFR